jgi:hypothetical protein
MENKINIIDYQKTTVTNITSFSVQVLQMNLFKNAILNVKFFSGDLFVESQNLEITGEDYISWGNDDNYINSFVASKFNFVLQDS